MKKLYVLCVLTLAVVLVDVVFFHSRAVNAQAVSGVRVERVVWGKGTTTGVANNTLGHIVGFHCATEGDGDIQCYVASVANQ